MEKTLISKINATFRNAVCMIAFVVSNMHCILVRNRGSSLLTTKKPKGCCLNLIQSAKFEDFLKTPNWKSGIDSIISKSGVTSPSPSLLADPQTGIFLHSLKEQNTFPAREIKQPFMRVGGWEGLFLNVFWSCQPTRFIMFG